MADRLEVWTATPEDASPLAALRTATAEHLTGLHGRGHWSSRVTQASVLRATTSRMLVGRNGGVLVATLTLATKKPWAIDPAYFTAVERALYLHDMAVAPGVQRRGVGRQMLDEATAVARARPR